MKYGFIIAYSVIELGKLGNPWRVEIMARGKKALEVRCNGLRFLVPCVPNIVNGL